MALDAWVALKSLLPPKERRGIVLIDPPFEEARELDRMLEGLRAGWNGSPPASISPGILSRTRSRSPVFMPALAALGVPELMRVELLIQRPSDPDRLNGCGLVVVNPPYTLDGELTVPSRS